MIILGFKTKNHKQSNLRVTTMTCTSRLSGDLIETSQRHLKPAGKQKFC